MFQGIRDLKCDHCDAAFHIRQCLKSHMKRIHGIKLPPPVKKQKQEKPAAASDPAADEAVTDAAVPKQRKKRGPRKKKGAEIEQQAQQQAGAGGAGGGEGDQWIPQAQVVQPPQGFLGPPATSGKRH